MKGVRCKYMEIIKKALLNLYIGYQTLSFYLCNDLHIEAMPLSHIELTQKKLGELLARLTIGH